MPFKHIKGFSLPIAVFIIVIMSLIGAAAVSVLQSGENSVANEAVSTRAFYASQTGQQWALAQLFPLDGSPADCQSPYAAPPGFNNSDLAACSVTIHCSSTTINAKIYYRLDSVATCSFGASSATRHTEVLATIP